MALRLGGALKELRIHLCQTGKQSAGVREFIQKYYVNIKKENPNFPILIRECSGVQPRVWARYEKGVEQSAPLTDLSAPDVLTAIKQLVK
ncbi:NADH dehydrogenase [ubiquinone] 1 alpha subcomplex subunit 2 [Aricia agestis]|uniref:NADH dehydrogenase [ubiquinone] 1 alpha subcomplex subunit 2 n=1 Tax=Aricia agestis TaxID=91739 RepID=UPI001C20364C|nr:NADH dehydrogenase [ubiquinone] 1 alpha subcomplex subunit 2 [Aricia agestis]